MNEIKKLIIVGNGFDIAHNYKTAYNDFVNSTNDISVLDFKKSVEKYELSNKEQIKYWYEFENVINAMSLEWFKSYFDAVASEGEKEIQAQDTEILKINNSFDRINLLLKDYLKNITKDNKEYKIKSLENEISLESKLINFNYTDVAEQYTDEIYYIHGSINKDDFIVLGYPRRQEPFGIDYKASKYLKNKLRELLNFKRYLQKNNIDQNQDYGKKLISEMITHIECMFSGRGGYEFEYSQELHKEIRDEEDKIDIKNNDDYNLFVKGYSEYSSLSDGIKKKMRDERLRKLPREINNYGELYNFAPMHIDLGVDFKLITELVILGHSLESDFDIIHNLMNICKNLLKIKIYSYDGESESSLKKKVLFFKDYDIEIEIAGY
ncbi:hypothetical protein UT300003_29370 [Clostridium sardiniense]